jgi:Protein of unknown function (DUF3800)
MRLYIDEVGNSDLKGASADPNVRFLSLSGVMTKRTLHDSRLAPALEHLKRHFPRSAHGETLNFHRRDIMRREGVFSVLRDPQLLAIFNDELADLVKAQPYLLKTVQIDKKQHMEVYGVWQYDPYHYCLRCLIERYVLYLQRHDLTGDVVIEPRYKKADKRLKTSFERIYRHGTEHVPPTLIQKRLLSKDIGFFDKRSNVAGLQLADILAHPSARHMRFMRDGIAQPDDYGTRLANILVQRRYARNPRTRKIEGWGTKWLP